MSSYIIAGSADSIDTAYCEQIARRISSKYKNIDFRVVIKHPTQWEDYLQQICRIYGFHKKSNPIIYTFDGKSIGGREHFVQTAAKYFGLDEQALIAENISSKINMKLADELLKQKKIVKNGTKTYLEKILFKHKQLLNKNILKHNLKQKQTYLINGIEYIHRQINAVPVMRFTKNAQVPLLREQIVAEDINLMALSLNDQIKPEQPLGKQAFVTANQKQKHPPSQQDKMSQASKTNKMHESIISYDKDSKGVKQSNQTKLRIDEENDDVPDFIDYPYGDYLICELPDNFCVAFDPKSLVGEEMIFYHNQDPTGNILRMHNDGRPIKGHRVLIKEIHYENKNLLEESGTKQQIFDNENIEDNQVEEQSIRKTQKIQKPKTEPNIPAIESQKHLGVSINKNAHQDAISEPHSDLNLLSHLNFHTLFIHKPLSTLQLRNLIYFINQTNTIGCLQFLPENPNPRVKLYLRKHLLPEESYDLLPTERFIEKQVEEGQFTQFTVPSEKGVLVTQQIDNFKIRVYNQVGFTHYSIEVSENEKDYEKLNKIIKYTIDHMLYLQQQVRHDIGYNLTFTKKRIILSPLVEPYASYNGQKLYLDGLAFLGYVHTAKLERPYGINEPKVGNEDKGQEISISLAKTTGYTNSDE